MLTLKDREDLRRNMQAAIRVHHPTHVSIECSNDGSWKEEGRDTKIGDGIIQDTSGDVIFNV
jgi:hypothetical protein